MHINAAHILVLTVSARTPLSQPVVAVQLQMRSAMDAALCAVCMQDVVKVDACIHAFVSVLHVSHGAGSFGSSPNLHLHAPYLPVLLVTLIVMAVYIARLKLYGPSKQPVNLTILL